MKAIKTIKTIKADKVAMVCVECGKLFKKVFGPTTFEVRCPGCGSYDTEPA